MSRCLPEVSDSDIGGSGSNPGFRLSISCALRPRILLVGLDETVERKTDLDIRVGTGLVIINVCRITAEDICF